MKISNRQPKESSEPEQWEYKSCSADELNKWGELGWEAYAATVNEYGGSLIYMKRAIK